MARECAVTGKRVSFGNNVSHSNRKTRRKWKANLMKKRLYDEVAGRWVTVTVSARGLRTIQKKGLQAALKGK